MSSISANSRIQERLLSIHEALSIIKDNIPSTQKQALPLKQSLGKYLAEDIVAPEPSPRFTNSAMDGFALRWQDVLLAKKESPVELSIVGESQAGHQYRGEVAEKQAVRISTGAVLPQGCDTVVRVEDTEESGDNVTIFAVRCQGQDIRNQGEEFQKGDLLLSKGTRITAARSALLASVGTDKISIFAPCKVALLITGSELVSGSENIKDDQIRDSNMIMLASAIKEAGGEIVRAIQVEDDYSATQQAIEETEADVILCTGGISVGRHDHVKEAALANGFAPLFWRIRQKPGKPLFFARKNQQLLFGLPGNPVSAFMCYTHYVRPLIAALNGKSFGWPMISGEAQETINNSGKRTNMIRVQLQWHENKGHTITHAAKQGSHMLTSLAHADGYIILEPGQSVEKGERIDVFRYEHYREPV